MNTKNQRPNVRSATDRSASLLLWIISGLYLLSMVSLLLLLPVGYDAQEAQQWLVPAVVVSMFHMEFSCCGFGRMKRLHPRGGKSGAFHDHPDNSQDYCFP